MRPRLSGILISLLASTLVVLVIAEFAVRATQGVPMPEKMPLVRVKADPDLGWVMLPNDVHYTYEIEVRLNSLGFRGPEVERKVDNEFRILAIGNSHIYGQGLDYDDLLTTRLEAKLNSRGDRCHYRVVNMGIRAFSLNQEYSLLKKLGLTLDADQVLLFIDINDFYPVDITQRYLRFRDLEWYMFDLSGRPNDDVLRQWNRVQFLRRSALLMLIHDLYRSIFAPESVQQQILTGRRTEEIDRLVAVTKKSLDEIQALSSAQGIRLTVVAVPHRSQVKRSYENEMYQSVLRAHSNEKGIEFFDLLPALRSDYRRNQRVPVLPFDGHYDAHGNEVMASAIAANQTRCTN